MLRYLAEARLELPIILLFIIYVNQINAKMYLTSHVVGIQMAILSFDLSACSYNLSNRLDAVIFYYLSWSYISVKLTEWLNQTPIESSFINHWNE